MSEFTEIDFDDSSNNSSLATSCKFKWFRSHWPPGIVTHLGFFRFASSNNTTQYPCVGT